MDELEPTQVNIITESIQKIVRDLEVCNFAGADPMSFAHAWALRKNGVNFGLTVSSETIQDIPISNFYEHLITHNLEEKVNEVIENKTKNKILVRTTGIVLA